MKKSKIYIILLSVLFGAYVLVFATFSRPKYSVQEKRDLAEFPTFSWKSLWSGDFTRSISSWFSDSEPYRDKFLSLSMKLEKGMGIQIGSKEEAVTFHAAKAEDQIQEEPGAFEDNADVQEFTGGAGNLNSKIAHSGIIISGTEPTARAMMSFQGKPEITKYYADAANTYKRAFPGVNVYVMPIPTAVEYLCPDQAKDCTKKQAPCFKAMFEYLDDSVKVVNIYKVLGDHSKENIFLRTDHHWAPLGGFYAAEHFAKVAGVPFKSLKDGYEKRIVHGYVGTMYAFSKDIAIKNSPEDFIYWVPNKTKYETHFINYPLDKQYKMTGISKPYVADYFLHPKDGSGSAYCCFMGADARITRVITEVKNGRHVMIMKDSYGNTIPSCLFYSFEEVHVVDFRYFTKNMREYVKDNKITDILFANNIVMACTPSVPQGYIKFLDQKDGTGLPEFDEKATTKSKESNDSKPTKRRKRRG